MTEKPIEREPNMPRRERTTTNESRCLHTPDCTCVWLVSDKAEEYHDYDWIDEIVDTLHFR